MCSGNHRYGWPGQPEGARCRISIVALQQLDVCGDDVGATAEFIRELIVDGTNEGLAAARARGQRLGRPPAKNAEQIRQARAMLTRPDESVSSIARLLGVSRSTLYKHLPELSKDTTDDPVSATGTC